MNKLDDVVVYVKERIPHEELNLETYVTTDNLKQNKEGKENAVSLPPTGNTVPAYSKNDILIGNIRPYLRKIWFANTSGGHSADVLNLRTKKGFCSRFVYYNCLQNEFFDHMMKGSKGSKMPRGDKDQILTFPIPDYNYNYQKQIAKVLSDLDAKIEVNNKVNTELEAMAKLVHDYWFIQFDFPDANGKPYKSSAGKMMYNKYLKREIPEGWEANTLADWMENDSNGDWGESEQTGNYNIRVNCIRGADMPSLDGLKTNESPIRFIHNKKEHKILQSNDLIVEISGGSPTQSTGRISYVTEETFMRYQAPLICSNFCKSVTLKNPLNMYNFYYTWKEAWKQGNMFNFEGKTSGIRNLLFSSLTESFKVPVPDPELVEKFYEFMKPIQSSKQKNLLENQKLAELRDWLLPMLMNGQVKVVQNAKDTLEELFPDVNLYAEVAALQFLDKKANSFSHGKTYIQKTMSHLKDIKREKRLKHVEFEEYHWGMFSKTVAKSIDSNPFLYKEITPNGKKVYKVKANKMKELTNWMALPENQGFIQSVEELISLYQEPLIANDINRIELLNTVHRCMTKLNSDKLVDIRNEMKNWKMQESSYKNKFEKFTENETFHMIGFVKENM